jgi:2-(1,2-epoxy-1,2-dihydrophenyl)acetyl-CoA isomerase
MSYETILLEKKNGIATLTLNRPEKLNAYTYTMGDEIKAAVDEISDDDDIRVLVLTGAGRGFCSGADRDAQTERASMRVAGRRITKNRHDLVAQRHVCNYISEMEKPAICAVNGAAVGIGLSITLACDIRIASEQARFGAIWLRRALMIDGGASYFLTRLLGPAKALEFLYEDNIIDAREAERIGLVNRVVPNDDLIPEARKLAEKIARGPSVAIELTKQSVYRALNNNLEAQTDFEHWAQNVCYATEDHKEAIQATLEKREPQFKGR